MHDGTALWSALLPLRMEQRRYNGKEYSTYEGLPENLYDALVRTAERWPDKVCLVEDDGTEVTYRAFLEKTDRLAGYLQTEAGIRPGDHVALLLYNSLPFCVSFLALIRLGAVTLPLPSKFRQQEVLSLLDKADPVCVICDENFAAWMEPLRQGGLKVLISGRDGSGGGLEALTAAVPPAAGPAAARPEEPAILMFTSGTTSLSKGVVLSNFNIMHAVESYRLNLAITPEDSTIIAVPIYHVTGMIALLGLFLYVGGTIWLHKVFRAERVLRCVQENGVTFLHASPTVFSMLLLEREAFPELPTLRAFACGSSNMPREKILELHRWLPHMAFRTVYGLTETSSPATVFPCDAGTSPMIGSSGFPIPGTVFRVVDEEGREVPDGELGEIQLKGSVVLREYYRQELDTLSRDGWLSTGDIGRFTEDGYIFLVDRKKDMINRGGEKICSYDVENELYRIPGVAEAAVVGIADPLYGEVAAAMIQCGSGAELDQEKILAVLRDRLAKYKLPQRILFTDQMPVTPNGKIDKKRIRTMFAQEKGERE